MTHRLGTTATADALGHRSASRHAGAAPSRALPVAPVRTHDAAFLQRWADGGPVHREVVLS